ncbi:synaptogenesis protein syg-2-like [Cimex lectularius]|uniref:Nephrin n=1 Tax=Cimex lectularius TaxID=79782 RepID=A0A8I6RWF4_CIMLE|nr:synaptogenesis protein syg-2-like [Cimex lectularius]
MGSHWKDKDVLEERAYFRTVTEPATLSIDNVQETDEAIYKCRVDFKTSPTRNYKLNLTVIVPPQKPTIFDDRGKEVPSVAGPYEEGSELKLTCIVSGGRPPPRVKWWRDDKIVDSTDTTTGFPNVKNNQLVVSSLERSHLHSIYSCQASNNNISLPVSAKVTIDMYLKPMSVTMMTPYQPLSADREYTLECQSVGSRPSAKISWWRDNKKLVSTSEAVSEGGNITSSTLKFRPIISDNGGRLICRADNPYVTAGALEDTWKLDVSYVPQIKLEFGSKLDPGGIEEGNDVYFECKIDANPRAYKVIWKHNNHIVQGNQKGGVIISHKDLALQSVRKSQSGNYTCIASNVEGDGESNAVQLKVMYKPMCKEVQKSVIGVGRSEEARVLCEVEAFPAPDRFHWSFNNSAENMEISPSRFHNSLQLSLSTLSYTPQNEMDYGTVMCWASNSAGQQIDPCVFHIIPAGRPDPPYNCTLINQTMSSLEVDCAEGYDGGQQQYFQLEVYDYDTNYLTMNQTARQPAFTVNGLLPGAILKLKIYAFNNKGRSDVVLLEGFTLKIAEKQTGPPVPFAVTPIVVVLVVTTVVLVTCAIVVFGVLKLRNSSTGTSNGNGLTVKKKPKVTLRADVREVLDSEDPNPDVIPCNKDSDYQLVFNGSTKEGLMELHKDRNTTLYVSLQPKGNSQNGDMCTHFKTKGIKGNDLSFDEGRVGLRTEMRSKSGEGPICYSTMEENVQPTSGKAIPTHREVISVRTPLMGSQQESCV